MKTLIKYLLITLIAVLGLSQLQPLYLRSTGAVDGTFGIRPMSHKCLGLILGVNRDLSLLPIGQVEFHIGLFHYRYAITEENKSGERPICLGQDLWFGE
jgi:hypothetical protein